MPVAVWTLFATNAGGDLRAGPSIVPVVDFAADDSVHTFKVKALLSLGKRPELASDVEVVGPCDEDTDATDFTVVLKKVTLQIGPYVDPSRAARRARALPSSSCAMTRRRVR